MLPRLAAVLVSWFPDTMLTKRTPPSSPAIPAAATLWVALPIASTPSLVRTTTPAPADSLSLLGVEVGLCNSFFALS